MLLHSTDMGTGHRNRWALAIFEITREIPFTDSLKAKLGLDSRATTRLSTQELPAASPRKRIP